MTASLSRKIERRRYKEEAKKMEMPKLKAIEVELSDGTIVVIHEPKGREGLRVFLSSMPAMTVLQRVFSQMKDIESGVLNYSAMEIPDEVITSMHRLFGVMTDITAEEFEQMSVMNQMVLLQGFTLFAPKKVLAVETPSPKEALTTP